MPDKRIQFYTGSFFLSRFTSLLLLFSLLIFTGCGKETAAYDPEAAYRQACEDAQTVTAEKISKNLTAIVPGNKNLLWETDAAGSRVLVVSWVNQSICNAYKCPPEGCQPDDTCKEGKECQYGYDTYVTVVPELKNFFKGTSPDPLRIAQLIGLPPSDAQNKACFLEMWVSPDDLFRPTPDPEISDQEAQIDFTSNQFLQYDTSAKVYADQACDATQCSSCDGGKCGWTDYKNFINNRKKYLYTSANPYPWTALGYTYDWGNPTNHVGLSEFVVYGKKMDGHKISVKIKAVTATAAYFNN